MSKRRALALFWTLVICSLLAHNLYLFLGKRVQPDTNILSLLPVQKQDDVLDQAFGHMVEKTQQRVIVLVGAPTARQAAEAADAYLQITGTRPDLLEHTSPSADDAQGEWLDFFFHHRQNLLTNRQRSSLANESPQYWTNVALAALYTPVSVFPVGKWQDDPFGLFAGWMQELARETPVRMQEGRLFVSSSAYQYAVLPFTLKLPSFSIEAQRTIVPLLAEAKNAAYGVNSEAEVLTGGVILHAAAATERAAWEISLIGTGSLIGIILLIRLAFRSFRPLLFISISLAAGLLGALSVSHLVYDRIHILTLVFGASLTGVAQDYAIYFLSNRANADRSLDSGRLLRTLLPALALALATAVIGYLGMVLTPFPGLHQVALFSICGLTFAWLTVLFWFPFLVGPSTLKEKTALHLYKRSIQYWPMVGRNLKTFVFAALFAVFCLSGLLQLSANDDVRLFQMPDMTLVEEQKKISQLMGMAAPTQFFLVRDDSIEGLLQKEEALTGRLDALVDERVFDGYQAISSWIPSKERQAQNRSLVAEKLLSGNGLLKELQLHIQADDTWRKTVQDNLGRPTSWLETDRFFSMPVSEGVRHLLLETEDAGYASVVALKGVTLSNMAILAAAASELEGVQWVDRVGEISSVLGYYRQYMGKVVAISFTLVFFLLSIRFRSRSWRIITPPLLAVVGTLGILGMLGKPLHLFNMLTFMLILGFGVDYGIFLQENVLKNQQFVWLEIGLSATSTLLAFGLLSLSRTPALHDFGLTLFLGLAMVWILVPCFRMMTEDP